MIISIDEAKKIDPNIEQDDLDAFEQSVRALTNNSFQNINVRYRITLEEPNVIRTKRKVNGLRLGDTIEVNYSHFNDGLFVVEELTDDTIKVKGKSFLTENNADMIVTLVSYPADIKKGIKALIAYDLKMAGKVGIKSETYSRMSTTYYDVGSNENVDGYPSSLLSFLNKYEKMRWS